MKALIQVIAQTYPQLQPAVFIRKLDTDASVNWQGATPFTAASTVKVPILVAFFQQVDAGNIRLDEPLSGDSGQEYTAVEAVTEMRRVGFTAIARLPAQSP
ncbi:MAG: hypothetical protein BRC47_04255 [Cyanobacteria bacterium QS_7_48_42]|nr:MAG: hypothetical protein BRC41_04605 [Cyanobacteria bacterium QH_9_48_43]PSP04283.1 MAG: hypothetical protein BRC47_04255 [Cyanobacteria bacterium QS_7_48_42]PSP30733.1 MAG: hypothetical protein BRC59_01690 [Cyanobacteria bacterium SW_4_48_29]